MEFSNTDKDKLAASAAAEAQAAEGRARALETALAQMRQQLEERLLKQEEERRASTSREAELKNSELGLKQKLEVSQTSLVEIRASHDNLEKDVLMLNDKLERSIKEQSKISEGYK